MRGNRACRKRAGRTGRPTGLPLLLACAALLWLSGPQAAGAAAGGGSPGGDGPAARVEAGPAGPVCLPEGSRRDLDRFADPVVIRGEGLARLVGRPIEALRLLAWEEGRPGPIPFQVDEYTPDNRKVLPFGERNNREEGSGLLEVQDELLFMARDLGDRVPRAQWPAGVRDGLEIQVTDPLNGRRGWCYLLEYEGPPPPHSPVRYVHYDWDSNRTWTPYFDNYNHVERDGKHIYRKIFYVSMNTTVHGGGQDVDYIDTMKFVGEANLLHSLITFRADHGDVAADTIAYLLGPIRGIRRSYGVVKLPLGLKGPKVVTDVAFYETYFSCPLVTRVPFNPRMVFTNIRVRFGTDLNREAAGMRFYNSNNLLGFLVDGVPAPAERTMDTSRDEWRLYTGPQGTLMMRSLWDPEYVAQSDIRISFEDDPTREDPPEHVPGNYGASYSVSTLKNIRAGDYCAWLDWYFPPHFYDPSRSDPLDMGKVNSYLALHDHPLEILVEGRKMTNRTKLQQVRPDEW